MSEREMTLKEFIEDKLPEKHLARTQYEVIISTLESIKILTTKESIKVLTTNILNELK